MPIFKPEEYREVLDAARTGGQALPAIDVTSSTTLIAATRGLSEVESGGSSHPLLALSAERRSVGKPHRGIVVDEKTYDPGSHVAEAETGMANRVIEACDILLPAGNSAG